MNDIDAIKARHSVRNYKNERIEDEKILKINEWIQKLNEEGDLHLQFIENAGKTFNKLLNKLMGLGTAPSVIACVGPDDDSLLERVGYYGEKIVLEAQKLGLNTCWAGTYNPAHLKADIRPGEKLVIVIAIGYGENDGKASKTRKIEEYISKETLNKYPVLPDNFKKIVELAILAPSALNQQKYEIALNDDGTVEVKDLGGVLSQVDLGIVKRHIDIAKEFYY